MALTLSGKGHTLWVFTVSDVIEIKGKLTNSKFTFGRITPKCLNLSNTCCRGCLCSSGVELAIRLSSM